MFGYLRFPSGLAAHLHLSWLDPHKERRFTVVGSRRMATFDDMDIERKVTVYDKGFDEDSAPMASTSPAPGTSGAPRSEPRAAAARVRALRGLPARAAQTPLSDGRERPARGRVLEALQGGSTPRGGSSVQLSDLAPGLVLGDDVQLGEDVRIGAYVVMHPGTVIGDGCEIQDGAILGKPPKLAAPLDRAARAPPPLVLGEGAVVCAGAIVFAGAEDRRVRDPRRPVVRARARADRAGQRDRARERGRQRRRGRRPRARADRRLPDGSTAWSRTTCSSARA